MRYWTGTVCLVVCGLAAAASGAGGVEVTCVDDRACGYGIFQSHNQKVVSNANGIFMTYLREDNEKDPRKPNVWRLMRSADGGKTFSVVYEGRNNGRAPGISVFRDVGCAAKHAMARDAKRKRFYIATQYGRNHSGRIHHRILHPGGQSVFLSDRPETWEPSEEIDAQRSFPADRRRLRSYCLGGGWCLLRYRVNV